MWSAVHPEVVGRGFTEASGSRGRAVMAFGRSPSKAEYCLLLHTWPSVSSIILHTNVSNMQKNQSDGV